MFYDKLIWHVFFTNALWEETMKITEKRAGENARTYANRMILENIVNLGISAGALSKLEENLERQKKVAQPLEDVALMDLDNAFHRLLFDSVNKGRVYAVLQSQMVHFDRLRNLSLRTLKVKAGITVNDHENILYALKKRDCELAEMVMPRHLTRHQVEKKDLCALYLRKKTPPFRPVRRGRALRGQIKDGFMNGYMVTTTFI